MVIKRKEEIPVNNDTGSSVPRYLFIVALIVALLAIFAIIFAQYSLNHKQPLVCGDGTFYDSCSLVKPYFCSEGNLVEQASVCGCVEGLTKTGESCVSNYQAGEKDASFEYFLHGSEGEISFPVYLGMSQYLHGVSRSNFYADGEKPSRADFKIKSLNEPEQMNLLLPFVEKIQDITTDKDDQVRIAISLVQNIPYGPSNRTVSFGEGVLNYSRYPYEVLYDQEGICGEKSALLAFILKEMGYDVAFLYYAQENHEALGIRCPVEYSVDGTGYCFIETVGPSIITDDGLEYVGGIRLNSIPQVIPVSKGAAIDDWPEFKDANKLASLRNGGIPFLRQWEIKKLEDKYNLVEKYHIV